MKGYVYLRRISPFPATNTLLHDSVFVKWVINILCYQMHQVQFEYMSAESIFILIAFIGVFNEWWQLFLWVVRLIVRLNNIELQCSNMFKTCPLMIKFTRLSINYEIKIMIESNLRTKYISILLNTNMFSFWYKDPRVWLQS